MGKSAILDGRMAVSQHFVAWICGPKLNNCFLYYRLQAMKPLFDRIAIGSTIKTIGMRFFEKLTVSVPPMQEQARIADVLLAFDERTFVGERERSKLETIKRGLMQDLLTGRVRVKGAA